jgi:hypothetical protein
LINVTAFGEMVAQLREALDVFRAYLSLTQGVVVR